MKSSSLFARVAFSRRSGQKRRVELRPLLHRHVQVSYQCKANATFANMESSNVLFLPFRKTTPVSLSTAIKGYISSKYDQHPDMFRQDLEVIDALRRDAVQVREPHTSGIKKISAYAGQISWMGAKFPIDVRLFQRRMIWGIY